MEFQKKILKDKYRHERINKMNGYKLYYKSSEIKFNIGFFVTKEDAEHWKDFLAFCIQEFPFENMYV